jgi:hypothetical protein
MDPESSFLSSQMPFTGPYAEKDQCSLQLPIISLILILFPRLLLVFVLAHFFLGFPPKSYKQS